MGCGDGHDNVLEDAQQLFGVLVKVDGTLLQRGETVAAVEALLLDLGSGDGLLGGGDAVKQIEEEHLDGCLDGVASGLRAGVEDLHGDGAELVLDLAQHFEGAHQQGGVRMG